MSVFLIYSGICKSYIILENQVCSIKKAYLNRQACALKKLIRIY